MPQIGIAEGLGRFLDIDGVLGVGAFTSDRIHYT